MMPRTKRSPLSSFDGFILEPPLRPCFHGIVLGRRVEHIFNGEIFVFDETIYPEVSDADLECVHTMSSS